MSGCFGPIGSCQPGGYLCIGPCQALYLLPLVESIIVLKLILLGIENFFNVILHLLLLRVFPGSFSIRALSGNQTTIYLA